MCKNIFKLLNKILKECISAVNVLFRQKKKKKFVHLHSYFPTWCCLHLHSTCSCDERLQNPDVMLWIYICTVNKAPK